MRDWKRTPVHFVAECEGVEKSGRRCSWRAEAAHPRIKSMAKTHHRSTGHGVRVETFQTFWIEGEGNTPQPDGSLS